MLSLKALSVLQPWASAIAKGTKTIETRSWQTTYRGPLLIHAGKYKGWIPYRITGFESNERSDVGYKVLGLADLWDDFMPTDPREPCRIPFGKIIAIAKLVDCVPVRKRMAIDGLPVLERDDGTGYLSIGRNELKLGDYSFGRYGWNLVNIHSLKHPIEYKGHRGLFNVPMSAVFDVLPDVWRDELIDKGN